MPSPWAAKNLQMPNPWDSQGKQMPRSSPGGEGGGGGYKVLKDVLGINSDIALKSHKNLETFAKFPHFEKLRV